VNGTLFSLLGTLWASAAPGDIGAEGLELKLAMLRGSDIRVRVRHRQCSAGFGGKLLPRYLILLLITFPRGPVQFAFQ
jgi:hypothetical protein